MEARTDTRPVVLLVEDDPRVRSFLHRVLSEQDHRVETAADGQAAVELLARLPHVDLLITDVVMPAMSGPEVADAAAGRIEGLRVLFISGYTAKAFPERAALPPNVAFLLKPFSVKEFLGTVDRLLAQAD